jgi:hypothetical protein
LYLLSAEVYWRIDTWRGCLSSIYTLNLEVKTVSIDLLLLGCLQFLHDIIVKTVGDSRITHLSFTNDITERPR